jgi:hypothetical protein
MLGVDQHVPIIASHRRRHQHYRRPSLELLGGPAVLHPLPRSVLDWVSVIRQGISAAAVDTLTKGVRISRAELATALGIPERTLAQRKREGLLSSEEAESQALSVLEILVQDEPLRARYVVIPVHIPDDLTLEQVRINQLPPEKSFT